MASAASLVSVMVLAAGKGTRLAPLTDELPKPLVPIGDRAAIEHVLDRVRGAPRIVVNAFHFADALAAALAADARVHVSREASLLGTAGGLRFAAPLLGEGDVLVWNSDVLCELDASALARAHAEGAARGVDATLVVRSRGAGEGNVGLDDEGRVVRLRRETFVTTSRETRGGDFLGIHVVGARLRAGMPERGCLVGDVYLPEGHRGARLAAFETGIPFVDVGTLEAYLKANLDWLANRNERAMVGGQVDETVRIGDGVVVGRGARVVGQGLLERVVVWPGAVARAPLKDAVVTPQRVVRVTGTSRSA